MYLSQPKRLAISNQNWEKWNDSHLILIVSASFEWNLSQDIYKDFQVLAVEIFSTPNDEVY